MRIISAIFLSLCFIGCSTQEPFKPTIATSSPVKISTPDTKTDLENDFRQAAIDGDLKTLKSLLSQGVDINAADSAGWTAIRGAVFGENIAAVNFLLKSHADPNTQLKEDGTTSLLWAVENENIEMVKALLNAGADPNIHDSFTGMTPLMSAADVENVTLTEMLLQHGSDVTIRDKWGEDVLVQVGKKIADGAQSNSPKFRRVMALLVKKGREKGVLH